MIRNKELKLREVGGLEKRKKWIKSLTCLNEFFWEMHRGRDRGLSDDKARRNTNIKESESRSVVSNSLWPCGLYRPWNSPGQDTRVGSCSLLQGIFPTQGSNPGLPHCRWILYQLSHQGSPNTIFSSVQSLSRVRLYDPMDCSKPGLPVHHQLPESTQTQIHWVSDAIQPSCPLSFPSPPAFNLSQHQDLFQWASSLHQVAKILL